MSDLMKSAVIIELVDDGEPQLVTALDFDFIEVDDGRGPAGPQNLSVGPVNTLAPGQAGLWTQTGLGDDGTGFTFWIEDGQ